MKESGAVPAEAREVRGGRGRAELAGFNWSTVVRPHWQCDGRQAA
jgi:hypothetical protein